MKKLSLFLLFFTVLDSICMEAPEAAKSQEITITSSDAQEFKVPKVVAERSVTIKNMLSETGSDQVSLNYPASTIQAFINVAKKENTLAGSNKDRALLDDLAQILPTQQNQLINIVSAANYLDYQTLLNVAVRKLARNLPTDWYDKIVKDLYPRIAKYRYLITGANLAGVGENSYGFSIRELMDYDRLTKYIYMAGLYLSSMRINDLDGLNEISGITNLQFFYLNNNQLSSLPDGVFNGLTKLQELYLNGNQLSSLSVGVFNGLTNLKKLWLDGNQLSSLPAGVFNGLSNLQKLDLSNNRLSSLPVGVFNGLTNLKKLWLDGNQLSSLPVGVFNKLTRLEGLYLFDNKFSEEEKKRIREEVPANVEIILEKSELEKKFQQMLR